MKGRDRMCETIRTSTSTRATSCFFLTAWIISITFSRGKRFTIQGSKDSMMHAMNNMRMRRHKDVAIEEDCLNA